jgi:hypothetical protein
MDATLDGLLVVDESGAPVQINRQLVELWAIPAAIAEAPPGAALLDHLRAQVQPPSALQLDAQGGPTQASVIDLADGRTVEYLV